MKTVQNARTSAAIGEDVDDGVVERSIGSVAPGAGDGATTVSGLREGSVVGVNGACNPAHAMSSM